MNSEVDEGRYSVRAVDRALDIIGCLAAHERALTVDEITAATGLPKSTVFRVLATLAHRGFVTRDVAQSAYRFGEMAMLVGARALGDVEVKRVARPFLEALMEASGETVHLSILNQNSALCIDKINSTRSIRMSSYVGFRDPLHCSGVGKALLAFQPEAARAALIAGLSLDRRTARTIIDREALGAHLALIRERGFALDLGEIEEGLSCVAAPIHDHAGGVVASVSASGPSSRLDDNAVEALIGLVTGCAQNISRALGYLPGNFSP